MPPERHYHNQGRILVIGFDFGMTFSDVAWAGTSDGLVHHVVNWPGLRERLFGVPSEITYLSGPDRRFAWGFDGAREPPRYRWFKALLETQEGETSTPEAYLVEANSAQDPPHAPDSAEHLIIDYLRCLREHVEGSILNEIPSLSKVPIEYTIAAPPGWSAESRSRALRCAQRAGMTSGSPELVSEPDAVAVFQSTREGTVFAEGNTYVLCDAGGRTVDLISFIYKGMGLKDVFCTDGPGSSQGNCGGTCLNVRFEQFLKDTLSDYPGWSDHTLYTAMDHFEKTTKRKFSGVDEELYTIPVPGMANDEHRNIEFGLLSIYGAELRPIIGPVVDEVASLVMRQINHTRSSVNGVILVGGFGERKSFSLHLDQVSYSASHSYSKAVICQLGGRFRRGAHGAPSKAVRGHQGSLTTHEKGKGGRDGLTRVL